MDQTTSSLADYALGTHFDDLPTEIVRQAKRRLIDTIACVAAAYDEPLSVMARAVAERQSGNPSAGVWGSSSRSTPEAAAFANGVMLRFLDYNDMYRVTTGGHPSDVIAAVLSVADAVRANGRDTLNAIVVAYEVYCMYCEVTDLNEKGWDQPVYGVIASAIGAGKLLGLSRQEMGEAISLAVVPNMAMLQTRRGELSSWKGAAAANAARNGVFAAILAKEGFTGPEAVFEGPSGFFELAGKFDVALDGSSERITRTNMKCFPVCYHGQAAVRAALNLHGKVRPEDVAAIRVETYAQALREMASDKTRWAPESRETADHSLPFVVAAALTDGWLTPRSFTAARLRDPALKALMGKIEVGRDDEFVARYPVSASCRLIVTKKDGARIIEEVRSPEGHSDNPLSDAALESKYFGLFQDYGPDEQAQEVLRALWRFDEFDDVRDVLALLRREQTAERSARVVNA
jgi:2-methylcitrate dehydratase